MIWESPSGMTYSVPWDKVSVHRMTLLVYNYGQISVLATLLKVYCSKKFREWWLFEVE